MARNNKDRLGTPQVGSARTKGEDPPIVDSGGGLSFSTPTEFIELPSKGIFYPEDHPLHNENFLEIRYMTAKDEDILTSKALLKRGIAIDRFLQNIIIDKTIRADDLYVGDKNALLIGARITGYGEDYECQVNCPSCGSNNDHKFDLSTVRAKELVTDEEKTSINMEGDTFLVTTPVTKVQIKLRLLKSKDEKFLLKLIENKRKKKLPESNLTDQLKLMIVSINDIEDGQQIHSFIEELPARDSRHIRQAYESTAPNIDLSQTFLCSVCDYETDRMEVPFTTAFFWPER